MIILAIETSCDDTSIALLKRRGGKRMSFKILSNIVSSQTEIHQKWGGVFPTLAKREHQRNLIPVLKKALRESNFLKSKTCPAPKRSFWCGVKNPQKRASSLQGRQKSKTQIKIEKVKNFLEREEILYNYLKKFLINYQKPKIDAIAVTIGPGLEPCLWVGVNFAKFLAKEWSLPLIPVNHIEAHIIANWLGPINSKSQILNPKQIKFPAICLIVSGGHTQLILMNPRTKRAHTSRFSTKGTSARYDVGIKKIWKYKILGETRDDAAGECFDKTARILGLDYPGGPAIAANAAKFSISNFQFSIKLPRPMIYQKNYDFSFSGLKTAVLYKIKDLKLKIKDEKYVQAMCREIQQAIIDVLISKTLRTAKEFKAKTIILGGGVAANNELRKQFKSNIKRQMLNADFLIPPKNLCTDNAAMIGAVAFSYWPKRETKSWQKIEANANLRIS